MVQEEEDITSVQSEGENHEETSEDSHHLSVIHLARAEQSSGILPANSVL